MSGFVIIGNNSSLQLTAFGTPSKGRPFASEAAAERAVSRLEKNYPGLDFVVLPITGNARYATE